MAFLSNALAYHDPDLNYHLSQVQNAQGCGDSGYSYPAPAVQLSVKAASAPFIQQSSSSAYKSSGGFAQNILFQAAPKNTYLPQPAPTYLPQPSAEYSPQQSVDYRAPQTFGEKNELSSSSSSRTIIPQSTYAQAPIIAKVTAAPLQAKYALAPPRTTYVSQNLLAQQSLYTSASRASLVNPHSSSGGPVVSQVYTAPATGYATASPLRVQPQVQFAAPAYSSVTYNQASVAAAAPVASQYTTSSVSHVSAPAVQYSAPLVNYAAPAVRQYAAPAVSQYTAPVATQYAGSAVSSARLVQYSAPVAQKAVAIATQYAAPTVTQYAAPVAQYSAPVVSQQSGHSVRYSAPVLQSAVAVAPVTRVSSGAHIVKNVHTEFLDNYVSIVFFTNIIENTRKLTAKINYF